MSRFITSKWTMRLLASGLLAGFALISSLLAAPADSSDAPFAIRIEMKEHNFVPGPYGSIGVFLDRCRATFREFDLLIGYDSRVLYAIDVSKGDIFEGTNGDLRVSVNAKNRDCYGDCPRGIIRLRGTVPEVDGRRGYFNAKEGDRIATIRFQVSRRAVDCEFIPMRFYWMECDDNSIFSDKFDTKYVSNTVTGWSTILYPNRWSDEEMPKGDRRLPGFAGIPPEGCTESRLGKVKIQSSIDFRNGGYSVRCRDGWLHAGQGDINSNGIPLESDDASLFVDYFLMGTDVFKVDHLGQLMAADLNVDGFLGTVSDFIYFLQFVNDSASRSGKSLPGVGSTRAVLPTSESVALFRQNDDHNLISVSTSDTLGAVMLGFAGEVKPELLAKDMEMQFKFDGYYTRILIYSPAGKSVPIGNLISYVGKGRLMQAETAGHTGLLLINSEIQIED